ncbi:MAG: alpha/beta fold hydrolase [Thermomicrobiales bacterium]
MHSTFAPAPIAINGAALSVEDAGSGPALVLVHAGIADARMWDEQMADFTHARRVVRYDLRGFGHSTLPPQPYAHHDDLYQMLRELGIAHAVILGASFGGNVATAFTLAHPELVDALILVGSRVANASAAREVRAGWDAVDALYESGDIDGAVELELQMWVDGPFRSHDAVSPEVRERVRVMNRALFDRVQEHETAKEWDLDPPAYARLAEIGVPTRVIVGALDQPDVLASGQAIAVTVPHARHEIIAAAAHLPSMEQPAVFNRLVLDFLAELPA